MKTIIITICFLFFTSFTISSQWIYQKSGITNYLNSVYFVNENTGWVVGSNGIALNTINGGNIWNTSVVNNKNLNCVKFIDSQVGWIVGDGGTCLKTTDGGSSWDVQDLSISYNLRTIFFINTQTGWIGGDSGTVFQTTNGGVDWSMHTLAFSLRPAIYTIFFINPNLGWCGGRGVYKTTNGGLDWEPLLTSGSRRSIFFVNEMTGWAAGGTYYFCKTTDGGVSWGSTALAEETEYEDSPPATNTCVFFINENTGWYTQSHSFGGRLSRTNNAQNWTMEIRTPRSTGLNSVYFTDEDNGWAVGSKGIILHYSGSTITNVTGNNSIPEKFSLSQNYPNPFNPSTIINYQLPANTNVKLAIYDLLGREIVVLVNQKQNAGTYEINWDASDFPSGVYFYKLITDKFTDTKRMTLIK